MRHNSVLGATLLISMLTLGNTEHFTAEADLIKSIKKTSKDAGKTISKGANDTVDKTKNVAKDATNDINDGFDDMGKTFKQAFDKSFKEIEAGYKEGVELTNKLVLALQQAAYIAYALQYYNDNKEFIQHVTSKFSKLLKDKDNKKRLDRLMAKAASKKLDADAKADMQYFAEQLFGEVANLSAQADAPSYEKMDSASAPSAAGRTIFASNSDGSGKSGSSYKKPKGIKSFSISVGAGGGYVAGGGEAAFGFVGDLYKEPGKDYDCQGMVSIGGAVGIVNGANANVILGFGPTSTAKAAGGSFGVEVNGAYGTVGGLLSINWNFLDKNTIAPVPGFSVGYSTGIKLEGAIVGGYAWTFK